MRCRELREKLLDRELGSLDPSSETAVSVHLEECPACARLARAERRLTQELLAFRRAPHLVPEVTVRVLAGLPQTIRPAEERPSAAQLGWAAAAAIVAAIALATAAAIALRDGSASFAAIRRGFAVATSVASPLAEAVGAVGEKLWTLVSSLAALLIPLASLLARVEPIALGSLATGAVLMAATILLVIGHDLRSARLAGGGGA